MVVSSSDGPSLLNEESAAECPARTRNGDRGGDNDGVLGTLPLPLPPWP